MSKNWYPIIDTETCSECGACVGKCTHDVYDKGSPDKPIVAFPEGCTDHCHGCGDLCPTGSITYYGDDTDWTPPHRQTPASDETRIKELVRQKYSEIALGGEEGCGCGSGCCSDIPFSMMTEDYSKLDGYSADADLGLGCGLPTQFAGIKKGDVVVDLGSGAGNDCFVARAETGEEGEVVGIDFSEAMVAKARANAAKLGYTNVTFREGDIERMPLTDEFADVVVSNCVLNLLPKKDKIFREIFRVLKPDGHFCISDVVLEGELPEALKKAAEMYVGCVAGAIQKKRYLAEILAAGFKRVAIAKEVAIKIPDALLAQLLTPEEAEAFKTGGAKILSVTVTATKPASGCRCCG